MKRNIVAVIAYPIVFWIYFFTESFLVRAIGIHNISQIVSNFLLILLFIIPPIVSSLIAKGKGIRLAVFGSILHQVLIIMFASMLVKALFSSDDAEMQKMLSMYPTVNIDLATKTLQIISIIFLPAVILLAIIGGVIGSKIRKYFKI